MSPKLEVLIITILGVFTVLVNGQLEDNEIPTELRYLFESGLDEYVPTKEFKEKFLFYLAGYDDENRPVWIAEFGRWDMKGVVTKGEKYEKEFDRYIDWMIYLMLKSIGDKATPDQPVKGMLLIIDMDAYNFDQLGSSQVVAVMLRITRNLLYKAVKFCDSIYVINTNFVAQALVNLLRPLFGSDFERVEVYGPNPASWRSVLSRTIPREALPEWYGGVKEFKPLRVYG